MVARYRGISELIGLFYASSKEPTRWPSALVCCLDFLGGCEAMLFTPQRPPASGGLWLFEDRTIPPCSYNGGHPAQAADEASAMQPVPGVLLAGSVASLVQSGCLHSSAAQNQRSPACPVFQDQSGLLIACEYLLSDGSQVQHALFGMRRKSIGQPFTDREVALAALIFPHIGKAVGLHFQFLALSHQRQLADVGWAHLPGAQGMVDANGRLVFFNKTMKSVLERADGLFSNNGHLSCKHVGGAKVIKSVLQELSCSRDGLAAPKVIRIPLSSGNPDQLLIMSRVNEEGRNGLLGIQIKVMDLTTQNSVPCVIFKEIYRLTNAECRLLEGLLAGLSPKDASVQFSLTTNTIRSQLKSIYLKTGVHRQVDLLRMAMGLNILLAQ